VLVVTRYTVDPDQAAAFLERARAALGALAAQRGYRSGRIGRATDDPSLWVLATEWEGVGAYRRALSAYDVKVSAVPLLSLAYDEPTAYEILAVGPTTTHPRR
jgi:quinol monooxygenase YgiN